MTSYSRDTLGEIQVDFVWGNKPIQPNEDRNETLDETLDNHTIATEGWSNYPAYIPNYNGLQLFDALGNVIFTNDGYFGDAVPDADPEVIIPNFVRLTRSAANDLADSKNLQLYDVGHHLTISYVDSTVAANGKTVRVTAYDTNYTTASNASNEALIGLRKGDQLYFTELEVDGDPVSFPVVTVTEVNNEDSYSWFEFKLNTAPAPAYNASATGYAWAGPNLVNIVTVQRPNRTAPGMVANEGRNINVRYFSLD
jgi:hypothetical protein